MSASSGAPAAPAEALGTIFTTVAWPAVASAAGTPVQTSLLGATVRVASARADRLSLAVDRSYELEWASVAARHLHADRARLRSFGEAARHAGSSQLVLGRGGRRDSA